MALFVEQWNLICVWQGDVDVVCGGPPCQGISGFNRFRNTKNPLDDPKNSQLIVFMDVVDYLKPRFVLMENVVDILKFKDGYLGGYALGRLIGMNYQARTGIMAAGCYGLPQFRLRVFLWGAHHVEVLLYNFIETFLLLQLTIQCVNILFYRIFPNIRCQLMML